MTFAKKFYQEATVFMTDFQSSYKVLAFDKILPCGNFRQYDGVPLNIFRSKVHFLSLLLSLQCFTC